MTGESARRDAPPPHRGRDTADERRRAVRAGWAWLLSGLGLLLVTAVIFSVFWDAPPGALSARTLLALPTVGVVCIAVSLYLFVKKKPLSTEPTVRYPYAPWNRPHGDDDDDGTQTRGDG